MLPASGAAGITVCLGGSCAEEIAGSARRSLLTNTAELFRDHGIRLAGTKENEDTETGSDGKPTVLC